MTKFMKVVAAVLIVTGGMLVAVNYHSKLFAGRALPYLSWISGAREATGREIFRREGCFYCHGFTDAMADSLPEDHPAADMTVEKRLDVIRYLQSLEEPNTVQR